MKRREGGGGIHKMCYNVKRGDSKNSDFSLVRTNIARLSS